MQIKNGFLNQRTKQDDGRSKPNTHTTLPDGKSLVRLRGARTEKNKTMDRSIIRESGG